MSYCSLKVICNWEKYVSFKKQMVLMFKGEICLWINICGENVSLEKLLMGNCVPGETSKGVIMCLEKFAMG